MDVSPPSAAGAAAVAPYPSALAAWYSTVLLAFLYWLSVLDRFVISLLVDPIKADLGISDVQFGLLHGAAFAVAFALFGLLAGVLADRYSRRLIVFASVAVWSLSTAICGAASNFVQLLSARVGVGAGEAGLNPAASSMITDLFPRYRLTTAMSVYALGASVGGGCAYLFGGYIVDLVASAPPLHFPLVGSVAPWQAVFFIIGIPGVALSFLSFTMPEPIRRGVGRDKREGQGMLDGYRNLLTLMGKNRSFFTYHYLGFGIASLCFAGVGAWLPAHMARHFGFSASEIGLYLGGVMVVSGLIGKPLCGLCIDALFQRGYKDAHMRWYGLCMLLATPVGVMAMLADSSSWFLLGVFGFLTLLNPLTAVYVACLNLVTPNRLRGAGVAFYGATVGLIVLSMAPVSVAMISDYLLGGDAIGSAMAILLMIGCPLGGALLFKGCAGMKASVIASDLPEI